MRFATLIALLPAFAPAQEPAKVTVTDSIYPTGHESLFLGDERWQCARVIDAISGQPIPGAELLLVAESEHPMRGELWWSMRAEADADGFVSIRCDKDAPDYRHWSWTIVRAPGYGAAVQMHELDGTRGIVHLMPAKPMPVQVLNWRGDPVADALVGFCGGCGHTPDLAWARTDAQGMAELAGVDPVSGIRDLYLEHPDLDLGYFEQATWFPGEPALRLHVWPGTSSTGKVLGPDGAPVMGVYVGSQDGPHRGPWTRTAADGTFALHGGEAPNDLLVHLGNRIVHFDRPREQPFTLQLPKPNGEWKQFVRLPPVEASPEPEPARLDPEAPGVLIRNLDDCYLNLCTKRERRDISTEAFHGIPIALPDEPFVFELSHAFPRYQAGARRLFPFTRGEAVAAAPIRLRWYRPTRIEGQVVDGEGQPCEALIDVIPGRMGIDTFEFEDEVHDSTLRTWGAFSLPIEEEGLVLLVVRDARYRMRPRMVPLILPPRGDDVHIDAGTLQLGRAPQLTIRDETGEPLSWPRLELVRRGWHDVRSRRRPGMFVDFDGGWGGPDPIAGDAVIMPEEEETESSVHNFGVRFVLEGDGPWTLDLPAGELQLDVRDEEGEHIEASVIAGEHVAEIHGPTTLRRLRPGPQRIFVSADDHKSAIVEVTVPESGCVPVEVVLPRR